MAVTFLTNEDDKKYVKSINGNTPDENGNVNVTNQGSGGSGAGLSEEEKTVILTLFRNTHFEPDMSSTISRLEEIWGASGGAAVGFEVLDEVFYTTGWPEVVDGAWNFPNATEDVANAGSYTIFKPKEILGGKLTIEYNTEECNNFDISIRTIDANGKPGHYSTGNPLVTGHINWVAHPDDGNVTGVSTGKLTYSPVVVALPLSEKPYIIFRIGSAISYPMFDSIEGNVAKSRAFAAWVTNNVKCTIEED